jgi:hypothetical protein
MPMQTTSAEELAESLVKVHAKEDGLYFVELRGLLPEPVYVGPHRSPFVTQYEANRIKQYLAALIREVSQSAECYGTAIAQ